jgi:hypothetical protein
MEARKKAHRGNAIMGEGFLVVERLYVQDCILSHMSARGQRRRQRTHSVARVYRDVNEQRPREYWDYEAMSITWG